MGLGDKVGFGRGLEQGGLGRAATAVICDETIIEAASVWVKEGSCVSDRRENRGRNGRLHS